MKLIIYNNKSSFSTVLNAFLSVAQEEFEQIDVYFPKACEKTQYNTKKTVRFHRPQMKTYISASICALVQMFSADVRKDFRLAKATNKYDKGFIKYYFRGLVIANTLYLSSRVELKRDFTKHCVFSTWYDANAIAAAMAKKKYPQIKAMSYAHSYEVDFRKNSYTTVVADRYKERYLDKVIFISDNVMKEYIELNKNILNHTDKYISMHFGSEKKYKGFTRSSDDGVFRMLSCSGMSAVKRLNFIVNALEQYQGETIIEWTHLGSGSEESNIHRLASGLSKKKNVRIYLEGRKSNDEVHKYYITHKIDLFINVSESEGLPVSIMEAMSYGVPVLATDVGGNSEIVTEKTGYLVNARITPKELSTIFEQMTLNIHSVISKRDSAFQMWRDNYQISNNIERLMKLFYEPTV